MLTSITDIQTYKRCRRKWNYSSSNRKNLTIVGLKAPALELGSLIHAALADWTLHPLSSPDRLFAIHASNRMEEIATQYLEVNGMPISDTELEPLVASIELGLSMIKNYALQWKQPLPNNFTYAEPEQDIVVEIPGTEHTCTKCYGTGRTNADGGVWQVAAIRSYTKEELAKHSTKNCEECNGTGTAQHKLRAILDGLIQDRNGVYVVLERKTFSPRYRPTDEKLANTDQFMGYVWVLKQLDIGRVGGVAYDGLCKSAKPPRGKNLAHLFLRTLVPFTQAQIDDWGYQLANVVNEMASEPIIYPNRPWQGCEMDCSFISLCNSESRGEDIDNVIRLNYTQRTDKKPILVTSEA